MCSPSLPFDDGVGRWLMLFVFCAAVEQRQFGCCRVGREVCDRALVDWLIVFVLLGACRRCLLMFGVFGGGEIMKCACGGRH